MRLYEILSEEPYFLEIRVNDRVTREYFRRLDKSEPGTGINSVTSLRGSIP